MDCLKGFTMGLDNHIRKIALLVIALISLICCDTVKGDSQTNMPPDIEKPENEIPENPANDGFVILFTNDFHSQIEPTDSDKGGIKRLKALVDSVRNAEPHVILADAGDLVQGTYYFSLLNGEVEMMILDELGYDVRTIGNHEFDKKMIGLGEMFAMSNVPVIATNYDFSNTSLAMYVQESTIINAGSLKIGFIGLNVMLDGLVDPASCEGVGWQNAINVADSEADELRKQGADMVIALSHLGYYEDNTKYYYDRGIAMNTRNIDMIIGGHTHTTLRKADYVTNKDSEKVPVVQTGSKGMNLGYAKISIKNGKPSFSYRLLPVDKRLDNRIDSDFAQMIDSYTEDLSEKMEEVLGYCPKTLSKGNPESPLGNLTADAMIWSARECFGTDADVSIYNSGGIRSSIYKGDVTLGDVYATYPFDNKISLVTMTGKELKSLFDAIARMGGMPVNSDVRLVISNSKVKSLTIRGKEIDEKATYTLATIDYLVNTEDYLQNILSRRDSEEYVRDWFGKYFKFRADNDPKGQITASKEGRIIIEQ